MPLPNAPWVEALDKNDPKLLEYVDQLREYVLVDGALSAKVKALMRLLGVALQAHTEGVQGLAELAREFGASEQEIAETVQMVYYLGGLPAMAAASAALRT